MNTPDTIYQPYRELIVSHIDHARTVNRPGISIPVRVTYDHIATSLDKKNLSFHLVGQALAALNNTPDTTIVVTDPSYDEYDNKILKANVFIAIRGSYPTADDGISRLTEALKDTSCPTCKLVIKTED